MKTKDKDKIELCDREKCTACLACLEVCPKHCVSVKKDAYGNDTPFINREECVDCGKCQEVCPVINSVQLRQPTKVYAAFSSNSTIHRESASGGVASELALEILQSGGVVYGAAQTKDLIIEHIRITEKEEIERLKGSKYVHSHNKGHYKKIKTDLLNGLQVLFVGTPCQVAGLKKYLNNEQYDNLFCIDLICHGVPSQKTFLDCMEYETGEKTFEGWNISFRDEDGFEIKLKNPLDEVKYKLNLKNSFYYNGFMEGYIYRKNCYICEYARPERCGDITLGDFWGLGDDIPFFAEKKDGINVILINTEPGLRLFNRIKNNLQYWERTYNEARLKNGQLNQPTSKTSHCEKFLKLSNKYREIDNGNAIAVKKCNRKKRIALVFRNMIKKNKLIYKFVQLVFKRKDI